MKVGGWVTWMWMSGAAFSAASSSVSEHLGDEVAIESADDER
jgi:hypothetical protein